MAALIAGIGIGSIIAAVVGWFVAISNHRQAWINALRDDLATYLKELEVMHYVIGKIFSCKDANDLPELENQKHNARVSVLFVHRRILLRLNRTESLHVQLVEKLDGFMRVESRVPDQKAVDDMVNVARKLLKREWEVTKWGPLAKPIRWWHDR